MALTTPGRRLPEIRRIRGWHDYRFPRRRPRHPIPYLPPEEAVVDFLSRERPRWPWSASLAGVSPDPSRIYRVAEIDATVARERCAKLGIAPGTRVRPLISTGEKLVVELPDDERGIRSLEITYGWYIRVEPEAPDFLPRRRKGVGLPSGAR